MAGGPAHPHPLYCPVLCRPPGPPGPLSEESSSEQPSEPLTAHGEAASHSLSGQAPSGQCGKAQCASAWWENFSGGRFCKVDGRHTAQTELGRQCGDSKRWALTGGQAGAHQKRQPATQMSFPILPPRLRDSPPASHQTSCGDLSGYTWWRTHPSSQSSV